MVLPQLFDGETLALNIVVLPRNQNPLSPAIDLNPIIPTAPAFAEATLSFDAKIISGFGAFPHSLAPSAVRPLATMPPTVNRVDLFRALAAQFKIANLHQTNVDLDSNTDTSQKNVPVPQHLSVLKYLPITYRKAFNFTTPRTPNATTGDAYSCAVESAAPVPGFRRSPDTISWGKLFGYALRQPLLATQLGMIYQAQLPIEAADFAAGGWLFIDLAHGSDYAAQQAADSTFIARYAARIPSLTPGTRRSVFAPMQVPVLYKAKASDPDPAPDGDYDTVLLETSDYDDGFTKIVHAFQPESSNLLLEQANGAHPVKDAGIRLGWDDEQILLWYMRQMSIDPSVTDPGKRLDAPLTVFGYAVDVRKTATPALLWDSLTLVRSSKPLEIPTADTPPSEPIQLGTFEGELPYQVFPTQLDGDPTKPYWLPMYFATWNGHNLVLPDEEAADIYQNTSPDIKPDPVSPPVGDAVHGTGVTGPARKLAGSLYTPGPISTRLLYGNSYEFRVRLRDISGGGPPNLPDVGPVNLSPSSTARCQFKRFVAPQQVRVTGLPANTDTPSALDTLEIKRPLLNYPAVNFTGKYADPVALLKQASIDMLGKEAFGIEDPDVDRVEITVEVQSLKMDNLLSSPAKITMSSSTKRRAPSLPSMLSPTTSIPSRSRSSTRTSMSFTSELRSTSTEISAFPATSIPSRKSFCRPLAPSGSRSVHFVNRRRTTPPTTA